MLMSFVYLLRYKDIKLHCFFLVWVLPCILFVRVFLWPETLCTTWKPLVEPVDKRVSLCCLWRKISNGNNRKALRCSFLLHHLVMASRALFSFKYGHMHSHWRNTGRGTEAWLDCEYLYSALHLTSSLELLLTCHFSLLVLHLWNQGADELFPNVHSEPLITILSRCHLWFFHQSTVPSGMHFHIPRSPSLLNLLHLLPLYI